MLLGNSSIKKPRKKVAALLSNNFGGNSAQSLLSSSPFYAQLTKSLVLNRGTGTPTYTGASTKTVRDHEGVLRTTISGEARFEGARRVRNLIPTTSEDFSNAAWTLINGGTGTAPTKTPNYAEAPDGTTTACRVVANRGAGNTASDYSGMRIALAYSGTQYTMLRGTYVKSNTGSSQTFVVSLNSAATPVTATTEWTRVSDPEVSSNANFDIGTYGGTGSQQAIDILIWHPQAEDITGRTDQTTPSEYVSVGVLSAPYHGAGVDGVKYFDTDLNGNPLPTQYTYNAVSLNGVAGTYVSTPDSAAASITGDIEFVVRNSLTSMTSGNQFFISKLLTGGNYSYDFYVNGTGNLVLRTSPDGTTIATAVSSAAVTGIPAYIKGNRVASTGKVNFYTSSDGSSWTVLGVEQSTTAGGIYNGTETLSVGAQPSGANPVTGKIYRAQIYNGINGTLAVDFDASRYAGGTTLTGSTGETWTLNGSAVIHPTNQPLLGYQAQGARTNLCLQSNAFTTTWATTGTPSPTQNVVGPDGATSAWTLTDASAVPNFASIYSGAITLTAAAWTASVFMKKTTGALTAYPVLFFYPSDGTQVQAATVDTTNGVITDWTSADASTMAAGRSVRISSFNADFWRVELTKTGTAATHYFQLIPAGATIATYAGPTVSTAATGSAVFYGAQVELGSFASSYIATTTAAVARNADVLTYPSAGNFSDTAGWVYAEHSEYANAASNSRIVGDGNTTGAGTPLYGSSASTSATYDGTSVIGQGLPSTSDVTTVVKSASSWGGSTRTVLRNASALGSGAYDGSFGLSSIGVGVGGSSPWFGTIRNVRIGQRQLSASEMQAITR